MTTLDSLIAEATASGGSERANYQLFISGLCDVLGVPRPAMSQETNAHNDYVFERSLDYGYPEGTTTKLYVDCYKRGSFVLEAKQSARTAQEARRRSPRCHRQPGRRPVALDDGRRNRQSAPVLRPRTQSARSAHRLLASTIPFGGPKQ